MAPRITDPRLSIRTSQQRLLQEVQSLLVTVQQQISLLSQRAILTNDQVESVASDVQRLREDLGEVRAQTNPGVQRPAVMQLPQVPPPQQVSQGKAPLRVAATLEADQEGPQNQPVVRGSLDVSANLWKALAIVAAAIAVAQSFVKYLP